MLSRIFLATADFDAILCPLRHRKMGDSGFITHLVAKRGKSHHSYGIRQV